MPSHPSSAHSKASLVLISLAEALSHSGSQLEDLFWEERLGQALDKALTARHRRTVEAALDHLLDQHSPAYDVLIEQAETHSESLRLTSDDQDWDALLFSAPCLAWTRYQLPEGRLHEPQAQQLAELLRTTVLAPRARAAMLPELIRFDRLPQSFHEARSWVQAMGSQALGQRDKPAVREVESPADLLADAYFLVGVIVVPRGDALFQWQTAEPDAEARKAITTRWAEGCSQILDTVFTGCRMEYLAPDAYYTSTRQADQAIRPLTLKAAITWLQTAAKLPAADLRCAIVACGEQTIEEYRIGFCTRTSNDVIYGCVWPALSREESALEQSPEGEVDTWDAIAALLRESGIQDIRRLPGLQGLDYCEDCGAPYFPNMLGEMQHPELPEEIDPEPLQLH
ncbi:MAG: DUF2863 family protein [Castellaniella sp.]|uniref:DUF2863 family protein n=1 Tax=Castellaniella sp. TaxID=1955812 RepID=UPI0012127DEA|nr:DUF2863 family protein [Castellaniella sp.]TAN30490.1 MAG: DUF2863 family protein [Castellaniella sp.]